MIGLLLLAIIAWLAVSGLKIRDLSKAPMIACARCGHFLSKEQSRCPECGTQWDSAWLERVTKARTRSGTFRIVLAAILLLLVVAGIVLTLLPLVDYINKSKQKAQRDDTRGPPDAMDALRQTASANIPPSDQARSHAAHTHLDQWRARGVAPLA